MHEIGLKDLNDLHTAMETLARFGTRTAYPLSGGVLVRQEAFAQISRLLAKEPNIKPHGWGPYWRASLQVGDVDVYALFKPEELPTIGYPVQEVPAATEAQMA